MYTAFILVGICNHRHIVSQRLLITNTFPMNNIVTAIQLLIILVLIILENHRGKLIRFTIKWFLCNENDVSNLITEFYVDLNIVLVIQFTDNR